MNYEEAMRKLDLEVTRGNITEEEAECIKSDKYAIEDFINCYRSYEPIENQYDDKYMDAQDYMQEQRQCPSDDGE